MDGFTNFLISLYYDKNTLYRLIYYLQATSCWTNLRNDIGTTQQIDHLSILVQQNQQFLYQQFDWTGQYEQTLKSKPVL